MSLLKEHVCSMLLEQYAFQIWFWSIFNVGHPSRSLMAHGHMVLEETVQKHMVPIEIFQKHMVLKGWSRSI